MKDYTPRQLASIGKQYTYDWKPGGQARINHQPPINWLPLPDWDVVRYRPYPYGHGIVINYDPRTDIIAASFWVGSILIVTGPRSDFEFIRREEPRGGNDAIND